MQIKHTFLLTLILGLFWIGYAFAYSNGPDTAVNGVFPGINCTTGCHNSFAVNSGTGSVSVTGLPASWVPGQTYPLTVMVTPATGSRVFGFQLSAVIDGTSPLQQAGTLAKVNGTVQVVCGPASVSVSTPGIPCSTAGALQFAEHTNANSTRTFAVNWTAPTSAAGTVNTEATACPVVGSSNWRCTITCSIPSGIVVTAIRNSAANSRAYTRYA